MRVSLNWLRKYIDNLEITDFEFLKQRMITIGLDIEAIEYEGDKYRNFVIGEVKECSSHPNADKLTLCRVDIGGKVLDIVCGAPNVREGQKVCVALEGAVIPKGGFVIQKTRIRGIKSEGMICAEDELEISDNHSGIMELSTDAPVGMSFSEYIGANDYIFEIGVTPNRGDLFSHIGIAREIAAIYGKKLKLPEIKLRESKEKSSDYIKINIESKYCKRFTGRVIRNVKISESPEWLKKALIAVGLRPRNNVVDITNYVMYEVGQPLHAFDYDNIRGNQIIVKVANSGDRFITLDSKERILNEYSLMVCDGEGYSAIAGVMGGEFSEITDKTQNVLLESAYFDPVCIRLNSKKLGLQTDASQRFERGVDISKVVYASNRAAQLIQEIAGGEVLKGIVDVYPEEFSELIVSLRLEQVERIIGEPFTEEEVVDLLGKIEIEFVGKSNGKLNFRIPEHRRVDIYREIDLIEEIVRIYGYDKIKDLSSISLRLDSQGEFNNTFFELLEKTRNHFIGRGFNEIITYSQQDEKLIEKFTSDYVKIKNPNSVEMNVMRVNLLFGMLATVRNNLNFSGRDISLKLFETGRVFKRDKNGLKEQTRLCLAVAGKYDFRSFNTKGRNFDYFDLKGEVETYLEKLYINDYSFVSVNNEDKELVSAHIYLDKKESGSFYIVGGELLKLFDIDIPVFVAEIDMDNILESIPVGVRYSEIPRFPSVKRDLAFVVDNKINYEDIIILIKKVIGDNLKMLELFDVYEDPKFGKSKKSMAFRMEFYSKDKTLTDDEATELVEKVIRSLEDKLGITLRS
ncbi:MAG: phenylalanine--tRNA ligase subunit beta [Ignavibacteria bacterium]